ncbi:AAC(3) family N-acetyltransferase [Pseudoalteromonas ruthenica]|uniref:Aminoglycoside N(3)-acetyltransferase n=1 Tax=Pseudoalteromonas ruthenica TaxID=151081 RepID=A0A0F4PV42_9GAMM|nr:AAC(3) family N-acetyltransferase [Pseudoalteromonas ruthenica]KJY98151.1 hypothetical protein TW76_06430 [Pseudoalteromonas ruthenica]KJZ02218.1 hypothetical protein TW72_00640 [Pseudoalteromonas ruthenica]TMO90243.1 hypothetical protein CWC12_00205 [Pseudoalteromonas ruthenica]TMO92053.1 hypothetical protein CWC13_12310 [Pseudoalteromonas ruthenica]TMO99564.1 hypothetical protein CWC07_07370 [Pseudoalteromonas ruthenica]
MLARLKSSSIYAHLRQIKYRRQRQALNAQPKTTLAQIRAVLLDDLQIAQGDALLVHCGFGFLHADFTPQQLLELLKQIVGPTGTLAMPFYPPGLSQDWLKAGRIFDSAHVRCGTGVLAQTLADDEHSHISIHPIKAVAAWGQHSRLITAHHQRSQTPYDAHSPYYLLAQLEHSKSIGLGVRNCSMVHCAEDLYEQDLGYLYGDKSFAATVIHEGKQHRVTTFVHDIREPLMESSTFFDLHCPQLVTLSQRLVSPCYAIDNSKLLPQCQQLFAQNISRKKS